MKSLVRSGRIRIERVKVSLNRIRIADGMESSSEDLERRDKLSEISSPRVTVGFEARTECK